MRKISLILLSLLIRQADSYTCNSCVLGQYVSGCDANSMGTCSPCDACSAGYGRTNCMAESSGTCVLGSNSVVLIAEFNNAIVRKLDLATLEVSTVGTRVNLSPDDNRISDIEISCDGTYIVYAMYRARVIGKMDLTTGVHSLIAGTIDTFGYVDGVGSAVKFDILNQISMSRDCNSVYVPDGINHAVRRVNINNGSTTTIAGNRFGSEWDDGPSLTKILSSPSGVATSPDGSYILIIDSYKIKKITLSLPMMTYHLAGGSSSLAGTYGYADGVGTAALFYGPSFIDISPDGLFAIVSDYKYIRKLNLVTNEVTTLVTYTYLDGVALFNSGSQAIVTSAMRNRVYVLSIASGTLDLIGGTPDGSYGTSGLIDGIGTNSMFNSPKGAKLWKCDAPQTSYAVCPSCAAEMYISSLNGSCVSCQPCTANGYYKTGCRGSSPGTCVKCTN